MTSTRISMAITRKSDFRQAGLTLIETLVALSIFALVVGGALALFGSASASQSTTQFTSDLNALRASTKSLYFGQGGYGTGSLGEVLINGKKVPTTMTITGSAPTRTINHSLNGTITVTGVTTKFTVQATNIPTEVCIGLASMNGWDSVAGRIRYEYPAATGHPRSVPRRTVPPPTNPTRLSSPAPEAHGRGPQGHHLLGHLCRRQRCVAVRRPRNGRPPSPLCRTTRRRWRTSRGRLPPTTATSIPSARISRCATGT